MTLEEAIEEMSSWKLDCRLAFSEKPGKAIKLGIEALKRIAVIRKSWPIYTSDPLPGETKE